MTNNQLELMFEEDSTRVIDEKKNSRQSQPLTMQYNAVRDFWLPQYAFQVKGWLKDYWKAHGTELPKGFSHMKSNQLYAIYLRIRRQEG